MFSQFSYPETTSLTKKNVELHIGHRDMTSSNSPEVISGGKKSSKRVPLIAKSLSVYSTSHTIFQFKKSP